MLSTNRDAISAMPASWTAKTQRLDTEQDSGYVVPRGRESHANTKKDYRAQTPEPDERGYSRCKDEKGRVAVDCREGSQCRSFAQRPRSILAATMTNDSF